jgi:hypothetical protein
MSPRTLTITLTLDEYQADRLTQLTAHATGKWRKLVTNAPSGLSYEHEMLKLAEELELLVKVAHNRARMTEQQLEALDALWTREECQPKPLYWPSKEHMIAAAQPYIGHSTMIQWHGMWLGIETDGYTHS